jgi:DNA-cytosine methyltransferase
MVKYSCERCGKGFSQKSHYDSHNRRKKPCENNADKITELVDKAVEEKFKQLNNKKLIIQNVYVNTQIMQSQTKEVKYIDLFCGLGAFHTAFNRNNILQNDIKYTCVLACDINEGVRNIYEENYGIKPEGDINKININTMPDFDILCAGFPCFVSGTKVLTYSGYKSIEDVVLTDTLMTHTGKFQKILNLQHKNYNGSLYNITAKYHQSFKCTDKHPFYIREKTRKWNNELRKYEHMFKNPEWKKACKLTKNDYFGMKINENSIIPEFNFDKIINQHKTEVVKIKLDDPDMWFMMGYFIGDGWIEETKKKDGRCMNKIRFAINTKDEKDVLDRINNILKLTDKKCPSGNNCNKYGCADFVWFNIFKKFGKYAHGKLIPEWVQDAPTEYIQEFVNGYRTADGCITKNDCYEFTTVSYNLAFGLQRLYLKLGHLFSIRKDIRPKTTVIEGRTVNQRDTYHIRGYTRETDRKQSSFIENGYVWYAPFKIENGDVENEPVYNFEVENDNSYIVENTIVHNCQPFSISGNQKGFQDETKGKLFYSILKIIDKKKPTTLMLENVKNLHTINKGETFKIIKNELEKRGYNVSYKVIDSRYYNSPQSRKRIYIICDKNKTYSFKEINNPIVSVSTIIDNSITDFFDYTQKYKLEKCSGKSRMKYKLINKKSGKGGRQGERVYDITKCGPTVCASSGGPGAKTGLYDFNGKIRTLSVKETLKMFGFDETYKYESLSNKKNMLFYLGNSIVINVIEELIKYL